MIRKLIARLLRTDQTAGPRTRAQGLMEFALVLPLIFLLVLGVMEVGRLMVIYSSVSSGAKQGARYGSVAGEVRSGVSFYQDCSGMRHEVQSASLLQPLSPSDITIRYERATYTGTSEIFWCNPLADSLPITMAELLQNGDRIVISVTTTYRPIVPIVPIPDLPITFAAARTIFTSIAGATATPRPNPDLRLAKSSFPPVVSPDGILVYTLTVANPLTSTLAIGISITDTLPISITQVDSYAANDGWTCLPAARSPTAQVACSRTAPLLPGSTDRVVFSVRVPTYGIGATNTTITNTALVQSNKEDLNIIDNTAFVTNVVLPGADLEVAKSASSADVAAGTRLTYTLVARNNGGQTASANNSYPIYMTDTLPAGAQYAGHLYTANASTSWGQCLYVAGANPYIECSRKSPLEVGASTLSVTVFITAPVTAGIITNTATLAASSTTPDPILQNNTVTVTTIVNNDADILVTKLGSSAANGGGNITYVLTVSNTGPSVATNIVMTDFLPSQVTQITPTAGSGWTNCGFFSGPSAYSCTYVGPLAPGATTSEVRLIVRAPEEDIRITNTVTANSPQPDTNLSNNTMEVGTQVTHCQTGQVDQANSLITVSPVAVQANNVDTATVVVTLRDRCNVLLENSQTVVLSSSRDNLDTISVAPGFSNPTTVGQVAFLVRSGTVGTSTYSATANGVPLTSTAAVSYYGCVTAISAPIQSDQPYVSFLFSNETDINRRLVGLTLTWPVVSGDAAEKVTRDSVPPDLWTGNSGSPLTIPNNSSWAAGTDGGRTINSGVLLQSFTLYFKRSVGGKTFNLTTTWDDGNGGLGCTTSVTAP